eukprot:7391557-Prymnesium_polylepis.2
MPGSSATVTLDPGGAAANCVRTSSRDATVLGCDGGGEMDGGAMNVGETDGQTPGPDQHVDHDRARPVEPRRRVSVGAVVDDAEGVGVAAAVDLHGPSGGGGGGGGMHNISLDIIHGDGTEGAGGGGGGDGHTPGPDQHVPAPSPQSSQTPVAGYGRAQRKLKGARNAVPTLRHAGERWCGNDGGRTVSDAARVAVRRLQ